MEKASILIAEGETVLARDIGRMLKSLGYVALAIVSSGEAAIRKAAEMRPDLVLMDIRLRGKLSGVVAAEQIRARFDIPVVYLTAYDDEEALTQAKATGPFGFVLKPFEKRDLHVAIQMALCRYEMERGLRESEARFRALVEQAPDVILILDKEDGSLRYASPSVVRVLGYKPTDIAGKGLLELVHPDDLPDVMRVLNRAIRNPRVVMRTECRLRHRDGSWHIFESIAQNLADDPAIGGIVVNARNITERKQTEWALWESRASYRSTIDAMDELIYVLDRDLRFVLFNEAFRKFSIELGAGDDVVGRNIFEVFPFLPAKAREEYKWALETGEPVLVEEPQEVGGFTTWSYARKIPVKDEEDRVYQVVVVASGLLR